jgi:Tfp pilus assembly PilM family ATPase
VPRLLAIDLGSHAVKLTTLRGNGRQWSVDERMDLRVPQDGAEVPALATRMAALTTLFEDRPELKPTASDAVALALPGGLATFHRLTMPFSDRAKVEQTLPFAVEAEVPFDLDTMALGWRVVASGESTTVLAALAVQEELGSWIGQLAALGFDPSVVFVDGELAAPHAAGAGGVVAVIDLGHTHSAVSVVRAGQVEWTRSVNVGGWSFTRAIQQALRCSWAEAEARKHGRVVGDAPTLPPTLAAAPSSERDPEASGYATLPAPAREAMDGAIGLLLAELRSSLIQAEDQLGVGVDEVRLTGGSSLIPELQAYLAQDLGVPVTRVTGEASPPFALGQALALHASGQAGAPAIDLRVGALAFRGGTDWMRSAVIYGGLGLVGLTVAALALFTFRYAMLIREQSSVDAEIHTIVATAFPELGATIQNNDTALAVMAEETEAAANRAEALSQKGVPPTIAALHDLTVAFPPHPAVTVEVSDLQITRDSISFTAETDGYAASAAVEEALKKTEAFQNATKGDETKTTGGRVRFPITIPLGDAPADGAEEG